MNDGVLAGINAISGGGVLDIYTEQNPETIHCSIILNKIKQFPLP